MASGKQAAKFMVFSMPQRKVTPIQLRIADNEIEGVDSFNFLGLKLISTSTGPLTSTEQLVKYIKPLVC